MRAFFLGVLLAAMTRLMEMLLMANHANKEAMIAYLRFVTIIRNQGMVALKLTVDSEKLIKKFIAGQ